MVNKKKNMKFTRIVTIYNNTILHFHLYQKLHKKKQNKTKLKTH